MREKLCCDNLANVAKVKTSQFFRFMFLPLSRRRQGFQLSSGERYNKPTHPPPSRNSELLTAKNPEDIYWLNFYERTQRRRRRSAIVRCFTYTRMKKPISTGPWIFYSSQLANKMSTNTLTAPRFAWDWPRNFARSNAWVSGTISHITYREKENNKDLSHLETRFYLTLLQECTWMSQAETFPQRYNRAVSSEGWLSISNRSLRTYSCSKKVFSRWMADFCNVALMRQSQNFEIRKLPGFSLSNTAKFALQAEGLRTGFLSEPLDLTKVFVETT